MDNRLIIEGTDDTPTIVFDKSSGTLELSGRSLPENAAKFYGPLFDWVKEYVKAPAESTSLSIKLEYFNSSSAKKIIELLLLLKEVSVNAIWHYHEGDDMIKQRGLELRNLTDVPFEMRSYK